MLTNMLTKNNQKVDFRLTFVFGGARTTPVFLAVNVDLGEARRLPSSLLKKCVYAKMTVVFPCGLVL